MDWWFQFRFFAGVFGGVAAFFFLIFSLVTGTADFRKWSAILAANEAFQKAGAECPHICERRGSHWVMVTSAGCGFGCRQRMCMCEVGPLIPF